MRNPLQFCDCISLTDYHQIFNHGLGSDCKPKPKPKQDCGCHRHHHQCDCDDDEPLELPQCPETEFPEPTQHELDDEDAVACVANFGETEDDYLERYPGYLEVEQQCCDYMLAIFTGLADKGISLIDNYDFLDWAQVTNNPIHEQSQVPPPTSEYPDEVL